MVYKQETAHSHSLVTIKLLYNFQILAPIQNSTLTTLVMTLTTGNISTTW